MAIKDVSVVLDDRFQESCHKGRIHPSFPAPIYAVRGETKDWKVWQRGGGRLNCRLKMRMWRSCDRWRSREPNRRAGRAGADSAGVSGRAIVFCGEPSARPASSDGAALR
jgi:MoaA/NifB/PqqE/SkfB family radical SAM enzyme